MIELNDWQAAIDNIRETAKTNNPNFVAIQWVTLHTAVEALERMIPQKPELRAMDGFDIEVAASLCCPTCGGSVTNYWVRGAKPKHCQFCGQAIDWEEAKA